MIVIYYQYYGIYPTKTFTAIAPFWSGGISTNTCGDIFYRETNDSNTLGLISADIRNAFDLNFHATWTFIVTYHRVCKWRYDDFFSGSNSLTNSFQILITTDGYTSYTIYNLIIYNYKFYVKNINFFFFQFLIKKIDIFKIYFQNFILFYSFKLYLK